MGKRKRSQLKKSQAQGKPKVAAQDVRTDRRLLLAAAFLALVVLSVPVVVLWEKANRRRLLEEDPAQAETTAADPVVHRRFDTLHALLQAAPEALAGADIAEANLLCATALPGSDTLDIDACLARLDRWARRVASETERHLYRMNDPETSRRLAGSSNRFRAAMLLQVLQEGFNVKYNPERIDRVDFSDSRDLFLHGLLEREGGGTCVSMPVAYVAVGRRLGYPLKLVLTRGHVFCRWDAPHERFNIEGAGSGFSSFPDEYYMSWPHKLTEADVKANRYLVSLSPQEELACFMAARGHCLADTGAMGGAAAAYAHAHRLAPKDPSYHAWLLQAQARLSGGHPSASGATPHGMAEGPMIYDMNPQREIDRINAYNRHLMRPRRQPTRPNHRTVPYPRTEGTPR